MPGPGPGPDFLFASSSKKINQPSNGGGLGPWGPTTIAAGKLLFQNGYTTEEYIDSMVEKLETQTFATYIGNGVAIPHGMLDGEKHVIHTGISVVQIPDGVEWIDEKAYIVVGIAANSDKHMDVLASLAENIEDIEDAKALWKANEIDQIFKALSN